MSETTTSQPREAVVGYIHTKSFPELLTKLKISLAVSTYQAQRVLMFSASSPEKLMMLMRVLERPTGLAMGNGKLAVCTLNKIWEFQKLDSVHDEHGNPQPYDLFLAPRIAYVTGDILAHELAYINNEILAVNTRFSCVCRVSDKYSFVPVWRPDFVTELLPDDRCHLNGFALHENQIRYVSALGESNNKEGWRQNKSEGGILIDYQSGKIISRGLSMPHSPRLYAGKLWILDSGTGRVLTIDPASGISKEIVKLPGFLRGLAFYGDVAFVGLSKAREKDFFGDLEIEKSKTELECAVYAIDIKTNKILSFIQFNKGIEELFDIQIVPCPKPYLVGFEDNMVNGLFLLP